MAAASGSGRSLGRGLCPSCGRFGFVQLRVQDDGTEEHWYLHNRRGGDACVTTVGAASTAARVKPEPAPPSSPLPDVVVQRPPMPNLIRALRLSGWTAQSPRLRFVLRHAEKMAFDRSVEGWLHLGLSYLVDDARPGPARGYRKVAPPSAPQERHPARRSAAARGRRPGEGGPRRASKQDGGRRGVADELERGPHGRALPSRPPSFSPSSRAGFRDTSGSGATPSPVMSRSKPPYEVWRLAESRQLDERVASLPRLADAIGALDSLYDQEPDARFEVRHQGRRVDIDDGVEAHARSTRSPPPSRGSARPASHGPEEDDDDDASEADDPYDEETG